MPFARGAPQRCVRSIACGFSLMRALTLNVVDTVMVRRIVRLASTTFDVLTRHVLLDEIARHMHRAGHEFARTLSKRRTVAHVFDVTFHVLRGPPQRMGDERERWIHEPQLAEEGEHLPSHRLDVVLSASDDEGDC